jgi:hypothetical protein
MYRIARRGGEQRDGQKRHGFSALLWHTLREKLTIMKNYRQFK